MEDGPAHGDDPYLNMKEIVLPVESLMSGVSRWRTVPVLQQRAKHTYMDKRVDSDVERIASAAAAWKMRSNRSNTPPPPPNTPAPLATPVSEKLYKHANLAE